MKKTILILATAILFMGMLEGCRKTIGDAGGSGSGSGGLGSNGTTNYVKTLATVIYDSTGAKIDSIINAYTYDGQNRYTQYISSIYVFNSNYPQGHFSSADTTIYTYTTKTETISTPEGTNNIYYTYGVYYLNTTGTLADSAIWLLGSLGPAFGANYPLVAKYFYDANGYLIKEDFYVRANGKDSLESENKFTITNGNTTQVYNAQNSPTSYNLTFTNLTTSTVGLPPELFIPLNEIYGGDGITGHTSVNLINFYNSYTYSLDGQNRITKIKGGLFQTNNSGITKPYGSFIDYYTYY
jgi:hypothetical protein